MIKIDPKSITPLNRANIVILKCDYCGFMLTVKSVEGFDVDEKGDCIDPDYLASLGRDLRCETCSRSFNNSHDQSLAA